MRYPDKQGCINMKHFLKEMTMSRKVSGMMPRLVMCSVSVFCIVTAACGATLDVVAVGNTGNGNAFIGNGGGYLGAVNYEFQIGTYEVTAGQYTEFLNAVAASDPYGLYNTNMTAAGLGCGIVRTGTAGSYTYSVSSANENRPVNFVSWGDAARFANWLHNGQPKGPQGANTTEDGAYTLNGATTAEALMAVARNSEWKWAIPTDSEWYKAGYHKNNGDTADYYTYPTSSDTTPGKAKSLTGFPTSIDDPGNTANWGGVYSGVRHTAVGELEDSASPYGTFDQAGNVSEWTEGTNTDATFRSSLGGHYNSTANTPIGLNKYTFDPTTEAGTMGFRVVHVPEPFTLSLMSISSLLLLKRQSSR
jgi:sulfatase modifying factor 1